MKIDIINHTTKWLGVSAFVVIFAVVGLLFKGLNFGIDFSGGNLYQFKFEKNVTLGEVNSFFDEVSKDYPQLDGKSRKVQVSGENTVILRTSEMDENQKNDFLNTVENFGKYDLQKADKVGATIGEELKSSAFYALILGCILIVLYITIRFEFKFAMAAVIALFHDVIISVGGIALLGYEVNTPFIAAVLTILGYSINDTIVVFDRIRETLKRKKSPELGEAINISINQVMTRSINTSLTTFLAVIAILVFGGESLKTFITTLLIGVVAGTYSSIFVASPLVYLLEKNKDKEAILEK
ncbi:protein translocase subunit SecF [Ilyobacter polytropus]|uniref:Protein-export membrane protein SecF n=1 Tax=Ilyobacter polytropus (strain ATCC 51220 / DSM 2926 / LMG 16218 / CuHBu1) TaxID=572544 RepID=E3HB03_ILYPC|nr:protein translocase subunit SecF [Ilyobacter polytropus]ADO82152.1 protein translocase subunit secF [Ilyobacter polytropus DSM 2926]